VTENGGGKERRRSPREKDSSPISIVLDAVTLSGVTVDRSTGGVLLHTRGQIPVVVFLGGQQLRGRLVRSASPDPETISLAIELEDSPEPAA
jgi:hypothetical protein